jgi:hypothetical protein
VGDGVRAPASARSLELVDVRFMRWE